MKRELLMASPPGEEELELSRLLCRMSALGWQCWESERQRSSVLTNNDLIRYAGEVLKRDPDFGSRFSHILADEFQDTDGLQDELLKGLWQEDATRSLWWATSNSRSTASATPTLRYSVDT
jgi:superfamily I DNA/RNA helicase